MNHLEQLVAEWYEYRGYFVRRNVRVGKRSTGGYDGELDVVAYDPKTQHTVHIEASMDADSWDKREQRFDKKFKAGRQHIPTLFSGLAMPAAIESIALFGFGSNTNNKQLAGARTMIAAELFREIVAVIGTKSVAKEAVPEGYPLLRTIQFACEHRKAAGWS